MNINNSINKLLYALSLKGIYYKLDSKKFYSDNLGKYITKYTLYIISPKKDGEDFYSKIKLLKHLATVYKEVGGNEREETY